jgi:hypothetical protein
MYVGDSFTCRLAATSITLGYGGMGVWGYRGSKDQQRKGLQRQAMKVEVKKLTTHLF